jgi:hypothetical protein
MSRRIIQVYLNVIDQLLLSYPDGYVEEYSVVILTKNRANIRLRLRFSKGYLLAISEIICVVNDEITYIDYRYHFQDLGNNLIFRYDSTPHFPKLSSFPHHKHLFDNVITSEKPHIADVLREVREFLE